MAFRGNRGLVLNTNRPIKVKGQSVAKGTRVKFMSVVDNGTIKVKIQDKAYPKLRGEHTVLKNADVTKVERGRPAQVEGKAKTAKKTAAKKAPAKKSAAKRTASKPETASETIANDTVASSN